MSFEGFEEIASSLIQANHVKQAMQAVNKQQKLYKTLLSQRQLPKEGYSDQQIESLISFFSSMDTNNYENHIGIGEREGRVYSNLVAKRHFYLSHGIGRSGELTSNQPKAAGSSIILQLCNYMVNHALQLAGCKNVKKSIVVPMCTGMTLALCLRALSNNLGHEHPNKKFVIWPRIDQQSVLKSIDTAGFTPIVIENIVREDGAIIANMEAIENKIQQVGPENILCVLSTTSCFAPRVPDDVFEIGKICFKYGIGQVVNNAYGVQSRLIMEKINKTIASSKSTITCFVQSTDKNFMVPVGGAIVSGGDESFVEKVSKIYAGRASMTPILDLFITLLSMGRDGWEKLLSEREALFQYFVSEIEKTLLLFGKSDQISKFSLISGSLELNRISFALSINLPKEEALKIGGSLFYRNCTGPRVVLKGGSKTVLPELSFVGYGAHTDAYPHHYITLACAIGINEEEVKSFLTLLGKLIQ